MIKEDIRCTHIKDIYDIWSKARKDWDTAAREDIDFYLGNHFSQSEITELESRNQSAVPLDRLYSAIELFKAMATSKTPRFSAVAREDSDNRLSMVWRTMLEYIWDISDGNEVFKQAVHDYAITGLGYFYAYLDKEADYGRGEVKFTHLDPFKVYVDPNSRNRYFDDASGIIVSNVLTRMQLLDTYPELGMPMEGSEDDTPLIEQIEYINDEDDWPSPTNSDSVNAFTPDKVKDKDTSELGYKYRLLEHFSKVKVPFYRILEQRPGTEPRESLLNQEQFTALMEQPGVQQAIEQGFIQFAEVMQTRIKVTCCLGQIVLYEHVLNSDKYPVVPVPNVWTGTPYPMSDVGKNKSYQRYLNKVTSLITAHAQASAGLKLLIPEGSVHDVEELERDWANPNATIEYDPSLGEPHFPNPAPLPGAILQLPKLIEGYIDLNMGIFEMMQGNPESAPKTYSATMMMEDFGQRRSKSKLRDIEGSLKRVGRVIYNIAKGHYDYQKKIQIVQPNNDLTEYMINQRMYDDKSKEVIGIENDITIGQYDIRIVGNSTMPSNKWGEWQVYMEAYQAGLIDRTEALKKAEIFDKEGVMQRTDIVQQLQQQLAQAQEQIKNLSGDLQTANRAEVQSRKRTEVEKFKARIAAEEAKTGAATKVQMGRLQDSVKLQGERLKMQTDLDKEKNKNKPQGQS